MDNSRIVTYLQEGVLADALYSGGRLIELSLIPTGKASILGNVYVGKVKDIAKNIHAAFVEVEGGIPCYLPLEDVKNPIWASPPKGARQGRLTEGDELLVQVSKEAAKTKTPTVTTNISLTGKYMVLTTGNLQVGYSSKLKEDAKEKLKAFAKGLGLPGVGLILRTNAALAAEGELRAEYERLLGQYRFLTGQAIHRAARSCVLKGRLAYLSSLLGSRSESLQQIVTDDKGIHGQIQEFLSEEMPADMGKLRLYEDKLLPLKALYGMERGLSEALASRVWLRSGAYLVIEPTEALTVIDVNTGKCTAGKDKQETIRKINQEAAYEIARQMRLRNLSGIILVDFVDMDKKEGQAELLGLMRGLLKNDPLKSTAVDMTALGLMELTRKKQKKTLLEQAKECGI